MFAILRKCWNTAKLARQKRNSGVNYRNNISTYGRLQPTKKDTRSGAYWWQSRLMAKQWQSTSGARSRAWESRDLGCISARLWVHIATLSKSISLCPMFPTCRAEIRIFLIHRNVLELMACYYGNWCSKDLAIQRQAVKPKEKKMPVFSIWFNSSGESSVLRIAVESNQCTCLRTSNTTRSSRRSE